MSDLRAGQIWQVCDPRQLKYVRIKAVDARGVLLQTVFYTLDGWVAMPGTPTTRANPDRFNGKRGGYKIPCRINFHGTTAREPHA